MSPHSTALALARRYAEGGGVPSLLETQSEGQGYTTSDITARLRNLVKERGFLAPFATYGDNSTGFAWPEIIHGPASAINSLMTNPTPYLDQSTEEKRQTIGNAFEAAGTATLGSFAARRPAASIGAGGTPDRPSIRAYHGSPHDFDKFDLSKIGTGEGAQAYGHGLYFADAKEVAETYRTGLSRHPAQALLDRMGGDIDAAIAEARRNSNTSWGRTNPDVLPALEAAKNGQPLPGATGRMYEVSINAHPDDFLDWDKPLSQQSEKVYSAVNGAYRGRGGQADLIPDKLGWNAIDIAFNGDRVKAAQSLREAGIPGIKYLDQGSRTAGEGSRNYVVFDDALIEILRKYGLLGTLGAGAAASAYGAPPAEASQGYADGGTPTDASFLDRARRTANGAAGVADYYLGGLPSSLAGLMPWNTMEDTKAKAEAARDDWRSMYGRGALEAAENPFNPASGIILTLPMARRIKGKLHPDDMGGANRMEHVAQDLKANPPQSEPEMADRLNKAWQGHGVTLIPDTNEIRPYTTFETPGTQGLTDRDPGIKSGPLKSFYDDPALYAVNPATKDQHVLLNIDPDRPLLGQSGGWQRPVGSEPSFLNVRATNPDTADLILKHELTHRNAHRKSFDLPQGSSPSREKAYLEPGMTTDAIQRTLARIKALRDEINAGGPNFLHSKLGQVKQEQYDSLVTDILPRAKRHANYQDPILNPGEFLARMEQQFALERKHGRNPYAKPITSYDDLDLTPVFGVSEAAHRKYPKPE